jgi:hypothetical protein
VVRSVSRKRIELWLTYRGLVLTEWQSETHAGSAWDSLDTNAADAATSTAITTVSDKNFMLICLALGQHSQSLA